MMMSANTPEHIHILSLPRCGTHFMWSRMVESGRYQLIYDADRVPALEVLSRHYQKNLRLLHPATVNPNYNFQYNSLCEIDEVLTPAGHLEWLRRKYGASDNFDLFCRSSECQDARGKTLLSINRFVYTSCNELFGDEDFEWKTEFAMESLRLLVDWTRRAGLPCRFMLVIRDLSGWLDSQERMYGESKGAMILKRLKGLPVTLALCRELEIPVFEMKDVIETMCRGNTDFWETARPLSDAAVEARAAEARSRFENWRSRGRGGKPALVRPVRLLEYLMERDAMRRTSLVRSVGWLPVRLSKVLPWFGKRIEGDFEGAILNNARIDLSRVAQLRANEAILGSLAAEGRRQ